LQHRAWFTLLCVMAASCGGPKAQEWTNSHSGPGEDAFLVDSDFGCYRDWEKIGASYFGNVNGHTEETVKAAREGGEYPIGTIVQLAPIEAMVKRHEGFNEASADWEFFKLTTDGGQRVILERGTDKIGNIGGKCLKCHLGAEPKWDLVCGADHGCKPLPGFVVKAGDKRTMEDPLCD